MNSNTVRTKFKKTININSENCKMEADCFPHRNHWGEGGVYKVLHPTISHAFYFEHQVFKWFILNE